MAEELIKAAGALEGVGFTYPPGDSALYCHGIEAEWGLLVVPSQHSRTFNGDKTSARPRPLDEIEAVRLINNYAPHDIPWVSSGARAGTRMPGIMMPSMLMYEDQSNLETCTTESLQIRRTIAARHAMERVVYSMLNQAKEAGELRKFLLLGRVLSDNNKSSGFHINRLQRAGFNVADENLLAPMLSHTVTRGIYGGAGAIIPTGFDDDRVVTGGRFVISQKVQTANFDFSMNTTDVCKPLMNTRDEPLADPNKWVRHHDVSADYTISDWQLAMLIGVGQWVLRLCEAGYESDWLRLPKDTANYIARSVAADPSVSNLYELQNGKKVTALNIESELFENCKAIADRYELSEEDRQIFEGWEYALTTLRNDPLKLKEADWVFKYKNFGHHTSGMDDEISWGHHYHRDYRLASIKEGVEMLRRHTRSWWTPTEQEIHEAMHHAPPGTRAQAREEAIRRLHSAGRSDGMATWDCIGVPSGPYKNGWQDMKLVGLPDPMKTEYSELNGVLRAQGF